MAAYAAGTPCFPTPRKYESNIASVKNQVLEIIVQTNFGISISTFKKALPWLEINQLLMKGL